MHAANMGGNTHSIYVIPFATIRVSFVVACWLSVHWYPMTLFLQVWEGNNHLYFQFCLILPSIVQWQWVCLSKPGRAKHHRQSLSCE
jgi:hypothetical protein